MTLTVPQLGEGLVEARVLRFLRRPGDAVAKDEPVYEVETDKATLAIESPAPGRLLRWLVREGDVVPVGTPVAELEPMPDATPLIPPRTRAHARAHGLSDEDLGRIAAGGRVLTPDDVDRHLAGTAAMPPARKRDWSDVAVSPLQQRLNASLLRAAAVPAAVVAAPIDAAALTGAARALAAELPRPELVTDFEAFAFLVAGTAAGHDRVRARRIGDDRLRIQHRVDLGVAVATAGGDLVVAAVPAADRMGFGEFAAAYRERVEAARAGTASVGATVTLVLSHLDDGVVTFAIPVVAPPAAVTLFLGAVDGGVRQAVMAFDHTVLNGVDAARFLAAIRDAVAAGAAAGLQPHAPVPAMPTTASRARPRERLATVVAAVERVLGRPVDPDLPLGELGLTSAGALELVTELNAAFGADLAATTVWQYPTARRLARALGAQS